MESITRSVVRNIFQVACIIATVLLTFYCIHEYSLDKDVTEIIYKKFHGQPDELYPSITLCFNDPFISSKLSKFDDNLTVTSYKKFLSGEDNGQWNFSLSRVDYDDVSIDFFDYLQTVYFNLLINKNLGWTVVNRTYWVEWYSNDGTWYNYSKIEKPEIYVSARWDMKKCFTINIPFVENKGILFLYLRIDKSILQEKTNALGKEFDISMHYPFQILRSHLLSTVNWESNIDKDDCVYLQVATGSMDILKRRNKYWHPCNANLKGHDNITLSHIMKRVGCAPINWKIEPELPRCNERKQYKKLKSFLENIEEDLPPCQSIERLITTATNKKCDKNDTALHLKFFFPNPVYKEINILKAYGFQSLVGNAGKGT